MFYSLLFDDDTKLIHVCHNPRLVHGHNTLDGRRHTHIQSYVWYTDSIDWIYLVY